MISYIVRGKYINSFVPKSFLMKKKKQSLIAQYITRRMTTDHAPIIVIVGETGSGKSCCAMNLALDIKNDWRPKTGLFVSLKRFIQKIRVAKNEVIVIDECGVNLNSKKWFSDWNFFFSQILQTQRYKNNCYILVLPHILFLAKDHRRMINIKIECREYKNKKGVAVWSIIRTKWGKFIRPEKAQWELYMGWLKFPLPPKDIMKEYYKIEDKDKEMILNDIVFEMGLMGKKNEFEVD